MCYSGKLEEFHFIPNILFIANACRSSAQDVSLVICNEMISLSIEMLRDPNSYFTNCYFLHYLQIL